MTVPFRLRGLTVTRVEIIPTGEGTRRITLHWLDEAGTDRVDSLFGHTANLFAADLEQATALGDACRQQYLAGAVRMLDRLRGYDG